MYCLGATSGPATRKLNAAQEHNQGSFAERQDIFHIIFEFSLKPARDFAQRGRLG